MEWMLGALKELAERFKPRIVRNVRKEIERSPLDYPTLFDHVFERFYSKTDSEGRWHDPYHIAYSTLFAVKLVCAGEAPPLVIPATSLHDIGYHSLLVDKENWSSKNSRIIHMQEGSGMAAEMLLGFYGITEKDFGAIVGMVASHDNGYLGIPTTDANRLALRDADRAWVMHPLSFYKDWVSKLRKGENLSLLDLFHSRLTSFYGLGESYPQEWGRTEKPDKEDAIQSPPSTKLAKEWRNRQFAACFDEIQNNISSDAKTFRETIERHIRAELSAGRG